MHNDTNDIRNDLITVLERDELYLCYQPLIHTETQKMIGMEALVRWKHPKRGIISPMEFIPIAEETRFIISLGEWVLEKACRQLKSWEEMGYKNYSMSVNVSAIQLQEEDFSDIVSNILNKTGVKPEFLELEITENVHMECSSNSTYNLIQLNKMGVKISIDDFGTGYNSLKYLQNIKINHLKIDKTFISNYNTTINQAIIEMIILLGQKINSKIIAEGVETQEQYEYLKKLKCNTIQGYYFSEPLLPEKMLEFF